MPRYGLTAALLLLAASAVFAAVAPTVVRVFGGASQEVGSRVRLRDIETTVAFDVRSGWDGPLYLGCGVDWPEGSMQRRFRGRGVFRVTCAGGPELESPTLAFRSGLGALRDSAAFETVFATTRCEPPIRVEGTVTLRGGALERYLRPGVEPAGGLALEIVCEAKADPGAQR